MTAPLLEVRDLRHRYGTTVALDGVSFHVEAGEFFGLLGPNGAGKSTLLSAVSCLLTPSAGEMRLLDKPLTSRDLSARRLIGVVPQELAIYNDLTARENLLFLGELYGLDTAALTKRADEVLTAVGLQDRANDRAGTFSGGMKRRLNLGASLIHGPRLLLLDEPTVGVDPQSRNLIFEEVRRLNAAGVTIVYTSHYMEEVQALCTRIGIMDCGRLVACDTLPNLLRLRDGTIRFRVPDLTSELRQGLAALPDCRLDTDVPTRVTDITTHKDNGFAEKVRNARPTAYPPGTVTLRCRDAKGTLLRLGVLFHDTGTTPSDLEADESNLESVFLHLTGRALRD